ncbi:origin recognition complex subunit 3 isoform X2 [Bombus vosnesenskii]|uniref:Origin recognition complex subunit 3 n=1 Tax=Bombus vosnesenskii TaxID=207650 RepID=A0A6J3KGK6_9HYME|nr:origin recognition complex subunit 3 isoform X2 [Bombus vosnesenskii]
MDNVSVSKGVFVHKGAYKIGNKQTKFEPPDYLNASWYLTYKETWESIQNAIEAIRSNMFQQALDDLQSFVSKVKDKPIEEFQNEIQTAILLTGVNVSDHKVMFQRVVSKLEPITNHIAVIWGRDSNNIKNLTEESIYQLMNNEKDDEDIQIKKTHCHMRNLKLWHQENCDRNDPLVIMITDFESSSPAVLHDFILILSSYVNSMKFILIFGVATTLHAIHRSLTYDVTSKLNVQICMIQHFYANNINSLCCQPQKIKSRISSLTDEDWEEIKKLPSIEKYIRQLTNDKNKDELLNNNRFKEMLMQLLNNFHQYMHRFLLVLKCLHDLMSTLPNAPMGKQLREYYTKAVYMSDLRESQEYKECLQLLSFLSKKEFLEKLNSFTTIMESSKDSIMKKVKVDLQDRIKTIEEASLEVASKPVDIVSTGEKLSRLQLKEKLLKMSQTQSRSPYKIAQQDLIDYLDQEVFSVYLINPHYVPGNEIFCFNDGNLAKQHVRGSLRAAIHTGLNDPHVYLNCECCKLENDDAIPSTLPDLSIIYKLHLESRKLINMYDWLQAFLIIVDPVGGTKEQRDVDPKLQARFTQAVAELEFLGFIKSSRQKTDHVKRLT